MSSHGASSSKHTSHGGSSSKHTSHGGSSSKPTSHEGSSSKHPDKDKSKTKSADKPNGKAKSKSRGGISPERLQEKIKGLTPIPDGGGMRSYEEIRRNREEYRKHPHKITDGLHPRVMQLPFKLPRDPEDGPRPITMGPRLKDLIGPPVRRKDQG